MREIDFAYKIHDLGGTAYIVGGYIRDIFIGKMSHDKDYVITGVKEDDFISSFPDSIKQGKSFPVYTLSIDDKKCEVAFARNEKKEGNGYRGFSVKFSPDVTIEEDLFRRDTTMNAIAMNILTEEYIDPYNGKKDIDLHIIRAVSDHFRDDPVRAMRVARQSAQHGFLIEGRTLHMMQMCQEDLLNEPKERYYEEFVKVLNSIHPSIYFNALFQANILDICCFPVYKYIVDNNYHYMMERVEYFCTIERSLELRFLVLASFTKAEDWREFFKNNEKKIAFPTRWIKDLELVQYVFDYIDFSETPEEVYKMIMTINRCSFNVNSLLKILGVFGVKIPSYLQNFHHFMFEIKSLNGNMAPDDLVGPYIGEWLDKMRIEKVKNLLDKMK